VGEVDFSYGCYFCHWVKLWERIMAKWTLEERLNLDIVSNAWSASLIAAIIGGMKLLP
jgi:hypothetical protein